MKTIMVTGAGGDIGMAIVSKLSRDGNRVIAVVHNIENADGLRGLTNVEIASADVTKRGDLEALDKSVSGNIDWIVASHGHLDSEMNPEIQSLEAVRKTFEINSISLFSLAQVFLKRTNGFIVISSIAGLQPNGRLAAYSASKAAANSFATAFARNRSDKTFIALCPGPVAGKMRDKINAPGGQAPELVADLTAKMIADGSEYKSGDVVSIRDGAIKTESRLS
jgi:NAD(P)-dependent dehydrogenase (short-subunit alcohol dehydrogenase family)